MSAPSPEGPVIVVDDHALLADALVAELRRTGFEAEVARLADTAGWVDDVIAQARTCRAEAALVDLWLGVDRPAFALVTGLATAGVPVLVVTGAEDEDDIAMAIAAGAAGVVRKRDGLASLAEQLRRLRLGLPCAPSPAERQELIRVLDDRRRQDMAIAERFGALTRKESVVLALLLEGEDAASIARRNVVSIATVRTQIASVLRKLGVGSQLAAVALARRVNWVPPRVDR